MGLSPPPPPRSQIAGRARKTPVAAATIGARPGNPSDTASAAAAVALEIPTSSREHPEIDTPASRSRRKAIVRGTVSGSSS